MKPPTPEEFYEEMLAIKNEYSSPERVHIKFDEYICDVLKSYGFHKGVEVFKNTEKWYS